MRAIKKSFIRLILRLTGWKPEGVAPPDPRYVLISYPHTSAWDFFLLLGFCTLHDVPLRFMIKDSFFRPPFGWIMRALGGIPIDRSTRHNTVEKMAQAVQNADHIALSIPPEGTRKYVPHWKSGFYYVALAAKVPLLLSFINGPERRFGFGPVIHLTGDVEADLDKLREFYGDIKGVVPAKTGPIRFKAQETAAAASS
jgi:1-acyl-sn-glycerol-3-phosphate acyltransferase